MTYRIGHAAPFLTRAWWMILPAMLLIFHPSTSIAQTVPVEIEGVAGGSDAPVSVRDLSATSGLVELEWRIEPNERGYLAVDVRPERPRISSIGLKTRTAEVGGEPSTSTLLKKVDPVTFVTVGTRRHTSSHPPGTSIFNAFFDNPASRPHQSYRAELALERVSVIVRKGSATIRLAKVNAGPFTGEIHINVYVGSRLLHLENVLSTDEEDRAYLYDTGLATHVPSWNKLSWMGTDGRFVEQVVDPSVRDEPIPVRHRAIIASSSEGSLACLPPPHRFFSPRDYTDNLQNTWRGRGHRELDERFGFGIRQEETGGGRWVPWFNAPPGTNQRMDVFYLLSRSQADDTLGEVLRYTHDDRYPALPGHQTFTSHYHLAMTVAAMREIERGGPRTTPHFVSMFKEMGVNLVHLAEFHGDGHQKDPGPLRLPELDVMFAECRRLSDPGFLLMPGEEVDTFLGIAAPGQQSGHWMSCFPRPVYWTMKRKPDEPFTTNDGTRGTIYHVGSQTDMSRLLKLENGRVWSAHPRIKASAWAPDAFRAEPYFKDNSWLGAAWKAMPADLSNPKLGQRSLDLIDDMANWGERKQVIGEVDVFKLDPTHELYGHMNINYLRLDRVPRFDEGWQPVLDALDQGRFFVTTGEVRLRDFTVDGKRSGEELQLNAQREPEVRLSLDWTFPLRFVELISGDGKTVRRQRIELEETPPFGQRDLTIRPDLKNSTWVRVEAWDIAGNGAFSTPVWIKPSQP